MTEQLLRFISRSPNAYFAAANVAKALVSAGFTELHEHERWNILPGEQYFVRRNDSSIIAFMMPEFSFDGYAVVAAHLDSPALKLKPTAEQNSAYLTLPTERYGGMNLHSWFDRPLSVAGRVVVRTENGVETRLCDLGRDAALIPSVAIHQCRNLNDGFAPNAAVDMKALFGDGTGDGDLLSEIAEAAEVEKSEILDYDLYLYNRMEGTHFGADNEFIAAPRLDDLECAYAALTAFLRTRPDSSVSVLALFDSEEVGSATRQGADSCFLADTLSRISESVSDTPSDHKRFLAGSFMLSADNAHALHPNHPELSDKDAAPKPNGGVVVKYNANNRYTTDAVTAAVFKELCRRNDIPVQVYAVRSDMPSGSTLSNISSTQVSIPTVDIGLAQLAMHSSYETAGARDLDYLVRACAAFYSGGVHTVHDGKYEL